MITIKVGDTIKTNKEIMLVREGITIPKNTSGTIKQLLWLDAGYAQFGDYIVFIHANEVNWDKI